MWIFIYRVLASSNDLLLSTNIIFCYCDVYKQHVFYGYNTPYFTLCRSVLLLRPEQYRICCCLKGID
jgi:hypothetical protein